jgi:hypothetical protein
MFINDVTVLVTWHNVHSLEVIYSLCVFSSISLQFIGRIYFFLLLQLHCHYTVYLDQYIVI